MSIKAFFYGMGSVLNLWPTVDYMPKKSIIEEALAEDCKKLEGDWKKVAGDMQRAIDKIEKENSKAKENNK